MKPIRNRMDQKMGRSEKYTDYITQLKKWKTKTKKINKAKKWITEEQKAPVLEAIQEI